MGPKANKKEAPRRETVVNDYKIEDPINSENWRCAVIMAVERTYYDSFVMKEFIEESTNGRRQEVSLIDHETFVIKILNDFANGELPFKYSFLLNFSSVFEEAVEYIEKKSEIPILVLVKVVKALLFYLREESMSRIEKLEAGLPDPIKVMAERQASVGLLDARKKEVTKKGDIGFKIRPPSATKQDTELLKRGERAKDDQRINDAPQNAYFKHYVLLSGFYDPDFPLELIKAGVPLHGLICIDTSQSGVKPDLSVPRLKAMKLCSEMKMHEIGHFWDNFIKILWNPKTSYYFRETIFQVYLPQRLLCEKRKLRDFIYREISYLMYDLSDLKRQQNNYLDHLHLYSLNSAYIDLNLIGFEAFLNSFPNDCVTPPVILQSIINIICGNDVPQRKSASCGSIETSEMDASDPLRKYISASMQVKYGSSAVKKIWSQELINKKDLNLLSIYSKIKELDLMYDLDDIGAQGIESAQEIVESETDSNEVTCNYQAPGCGTNMELALQCGEGLFRSYWRDYRDYEIQNFTTDFCLYSLLMTKIMCPYKITEDNFSRSYVSVKNNSDFQLIENLDQEMRKPHFTVTEGSRSIIKCIPYNIKNTSRSFFCPDELKIVTPEKLKASSAPEFQSRPNFKVSFASQTLPQELLESPYKNLRGFIGDCLLSGINGFEVLEVFNKSKLLDKQNEHWGNYNCIDRTYSIVNDCIFLMLHNRKDGENVFHETFNEMIRTHVGLRDFYDYVMDLEREWINYQEELCQTGILLANKMLDGDSFRDFAESDFWMSDSIKFKEFGRVTQKRVSGELKTELSSYDKLNEKPTVEGIRKAFTWLDFRFEAYDVGSMAILFSGLNTVYYSNEWNIGVQLTEKLYGNQELGVHVNAKSHSLHLYSYVCPEPHISDPFTFHVNFKNGIIVAFSRRFIETIERVEEVVEARTSIKSKRNSSEISSRIVIKEIKKSVKDDKFLYNLGVSVPNGLCIKTVRKVVEPCYIKQYYNVDTLDAPTKEECRLFLPNGNVVKMMNSGIIQIFTVDATILTTKLKGFGESLKGCFNLNQYEYTTREGFVQNFENGQMTSSRRLQIFQNTDIESNKVYFRRRDKTNYVLSSDGSICVEFEDGTKMASYISEVEPPIDDNLSESEQDFVFVNLKFIIEHPDYATVKYDACSQNWTIVLPQESAIVVDPHGTYTLYMNENTKLEVVSDSIKMSKFSQKGQEECTFTADLSVFEPNGSDVYCYLKDSLGKVFVVEGNSNTYFLDNNSENDESLDEVVSDESDVSDFVASTDLQVCPSFQSNKITKLSRENKYFVLNRDITGMELLHLEDAKDILTNIPKGGVIFSQSFPENNIRCFVLICRKVKSNIKKWEVASVLPNPKYERSSSYKTISTTYGVPPSWMHPFPKRKNKFVIPETLSCRVFLETKKTTLEPPAGNLEFYNCEMNEKVEIKHTVVSPGGVDEYLKKVSNDDQDILKEMYSIVAESIINAKKKLKPCNSEKLKHYLEMSKYYKEMGEYHKRCIRYHDVPNYFHHPAGMSWLILNDLLPNLKLPTRSAKTLRGSFGKGAGDMITAVTSLESFDDEIEYNLSVSAGQSFSDLSHRSNLSAQTAPTVMRTFGVCKCKVKAEKHYASCPALEEINKSPTTKLTASENSELSSHKGCAFNEEDIDVIKQRRDGKGKGGAMSLEDLMYLGLV